jgi:hypothetical protein
MKSINAPEPFYKLRNGQPPKRVEEVMMDPSSDVALLHPSLATARIGPKKVRLDLIHFNRGVFDPKLMDRRVATLFARCNLPPALVEHTSFGDFIRSCIDHEYSLCCAQDLETEQHHVHSSMVEHLKNDLARQPRDTLYSLALDAWPVLVDAHGRGHGLWALSLYLFFVDSDWKLCKATVHSDVVPKALLSHVSFLFFLI